MAESEHFVAFDPGKHTGAAIFNNEGKLVVCSEIACGESVPAYLEALSNLRNKNNVRFALIENYVNFGKMRPNAHEVVAQIWAIKFVYAQHIMVFTNQWNPQKVGDRYKKEGIYPALFREAPLVKSPHAIDAAIMGGVIWKKAEQLSYANPFDALLFLALTKRIYPRIKDQNPWRGEEFIKFLEKRRAGDDCFIPGEKRTI